MNFFQEMAATLTTWMDALRHLGQSFPLARMGFDALSVALPLAALLAFVGLNFMSATARGLAVTRKRASFEKCARQLALLGLLLGWILLICGRVWLFFTQGSYTPDSPSDFMVEMSWVMLGLAVLFNSLYFALWKFLIKMPLLHVGLGVVSGIQACIATAASLAAARLLTALARPDADMLTLGHIYVPGFGTPFWCALFWSLPLMLAIAGGMGAFWLVLRRNYDDFGRDHYNTMLPWCATWARNAWAIFWVILLASSVFDVQREWQKETFTAMDAVLESAELLLWLVPALLWTWVARSATPMRHKLTLLTAVVLAVAVMLPFYLNMTEITLPASMTDIVD